MSKSEDHSISVSPPKDSARAAIIDAVKTPLGFYALVVLAVEVILGFVAGFGTGIDRTITIGGMLAIIIALISIVAYFAYHRPEALAGKREEIKVEIEPLVPPSNRNREPEAREHCA